MEDVPEVYRRPYDPRYPVVCMDGSGKQLIGEVCEPIPAAPGHPLLRDDGYVRNGVAEIFAEVEPSVLKRQCLPERIADIDLMRKQVRAWNEDRNTGQARVNRRFTAPDARIKPKRLHPKL
jgi:hypothetical protein